MNLSRSLKGTDLSGGYRFKDVAVYFGQRMANKSYRCALGGIDSIGEYPPYLGWLVNDKVKQAFGMGTPDSR